MGVRGAGSRCWPGVSLGWLRREVLLRGFDETELPLPMRVRRMLLSGIMIRPLSQRCGHLPGEVDLLAAIGLDQRSVCAQCSIAHLNKPVVPEQLCALSHSLERRKSHGLLKPCETA